MGGRQNPNVVIPIIWMCNVRPVSWLGCEPRLPNLASFYWIASARDNLEECGMNKELRFLGLCLLTWLYRPELAPPMGGRSLEERQY